MDRKDKYVIFNASVKHSWISMGCAEAQTVKGVYKSVIPLVACLFKSIEQFSKSLNSVCIIFVAWRRLHIDYFIVIEFANEICSNKVETFYFPVISHSYCKDNANAGKSDNWQISVEVI